MTNYILRSEGFILVYRKQTKVVIRHKEFDDDVVFDYKTEEKAIEAYESIHEQINTITFTTVQ